MTLREFAESFNIYDRYCDYAFRVCGKIVGFSEEIATAKIRDFLDVTNIEISLATLDINEVFTSNRFLFNKIQLLDLEIDKAQLFSISYDKTSEEEVNVAWHNESILTKWTKPTICFSVPLKDFLDVRHLNIYLFFRERGYDHERALNTTNRN